MKIVAFIVGLVLIAPALKLMSERYKFLTETKQKVIAWLLGFASGLVGLVVYWIIMTLVQSDEYEWLINDLCFIGFVYLCSYVINVYSAKCIRNTHNKVLQEIEDFINDNSRNSFCVFCFKQQQKIKLRWDFSKAGNVQSEKELKEAIVVDGACCQNDEEEIKDVVFNLYLAHMYDKVQKINS